MKGAECRSPVQRVMSTQSRDWLSRVRRELRGVRGRECRGERVSVRVCGRVLRRRWSVCLAINQLVSSYYNTIVEDR